MALYVNTAFTTFRESFVDLDPEETKTARRSREHLEGQISSLATKVEHFPALNYKYLPYGSFARRTKVRPLDDIDLLVSISTGANSTAELLSFNRYRIHITDRTCNTWIFTDDDDYLNSTKVLNKIKNSLLEIEKYKKAEIKRNNVAVVLNLKSYDWNFDIVPAVPVSDNTGKIVHYLIPDGSGKWMRTDPRIDQDHISTANQKHNGYLLPLIRLIKYWNVRRYPATNIPSYYLETMLINAFSIYNPMVSIKPNISLAFELLASRLLATCPDPKNLGDNLDASMDVLRRVQAQSVATTMATYARNAINSENNGDNRSAIEWWRGIFPDFPSYG